MDGHYFHLRNINIGDCELVLNRPVIKYKHHQICQYKEMRVNLYNHCYYSNPQWMVSGERSAAFTQMWRGHRHEGFGKLDNQRKDG